ncbi:oxygenase MpaB family protein [Amycolatopsis thailandensis]|uniref:oxygenase MpaB family protein n=1 Tax=Amycolatopsis thailandensis TaxID=589330 RepID=UPI00365F73DE
MTELNRRKMLIVCGGATLLGAMGMAQPAWAWSPSGSVAGTGAGTDPKWVWDAEADPVLAAVFDRGQVAAVNQALRTWTRNDQPTPSGLPPDLREFVEHARQLPSWADQSELDAAADFMKVSGRFVNLLNGLGGGMLSTAIPNEARAVYYSKGGADMKDRVAKTAKLGYDVGSLNAYRPDGQMIVSAVKTRLVHAAVRHLLPQSPHWQQGIPISQNDMLVTWHTLPTYTMRKLTDWRVRVSSAHSAAYLHSWQVTGHMLGIRDEYLPSTWDAAYAQSKQVLDPAMGPTREGVELTDILLDMLAEQTSPGRVDRPMVNALARYIIGDRFSGWNGIPREPIWDPLVGTAFPALVAFHEKLIPLPLVPQAAWVLDEAIRRYIRLWLSEGRPVNIEIPDMNRPS